MNSTHIKEANVEQDMYYTGIAEKAYDKVVRFLTKHKDKLEGEGENSIVNKPFIPLTQWKGVALRGTDIDKHFPSLSALVLFLPSKPATRLLRSSICLSLSASLPEATLRPPKNSAMFSRFLS